jgi:translocation and assembly module TamB
VDPATPPLTARFGGGTVTFGGRIIMNGFVPGELNLTANGERMTLNYPEGFRSVIDADLALRGTIRAPVLTGSVTVLSALYDRRFRPAADLFNFGGATLMPGVPTTGTTVPLRFDIQIEAPGTLRIDNNLARLTASADLRLQGTYDQPVLTGRAEIVRGEVVNFIGNRYTITRGTIDFANPRAIDPYFDIEAETRIRVGDQTYRVTLGILGTSQRIAPTISSDPPLPTSDILALILGETPDLSNAELRGLTADRNEADLIEAIGAVLLGQPLSDPLAIVAEEVLGRGTTVQIIPGLGSGTEGDPFLASARVVIGRRISNRVYLTYAQALGSSTREQIVVLEFDQNDRIAWVITQNQDQTFAIEFRVRHIF